MAQPVLTAAVPRTAPSRSGGRKPEEMRPVSIETGVSKYAEGSALITVGDTRVLCTATVSEDVPPWLKNRGQGWINAEYSMLPRATKTRTPRDGTRSKPNGRTQEIQRLIGRALRAVADLPRLGERTITVDCDVLQADGGTRTAAISGGFVALDLACRRLRNGKASPSDILREPVAAVSVGVLDAGPCLDLDYEEDSAARVDMNVVMTAGGKLVEVQGTAEKAPFSEEDLGVMLALARRGVEKLVAAQRAALGGAV